MTGQEFSEMLDQVIQEEGEALAIARVILSSRSNADAATQLRKENERRARFIADHEELLTRAGMLEGFKKDLARSRELVPLIEHGEFDSVPFEREVL